MGFRVDSGTGTGLESVSLVHRFLVGNEGIDIIKYLHWKNITKDQIGSFRAPFLLANYQN